MVRICRSATAAGILLLFLYTPNLAAENSLSIEIENLAGVFQGEDSVAGVSGGSEAELSFRSEANRDVKAQVSLTADVTNAREETTEFDVYRAFIRARLPWFRLTMGKTRLSWGEGFMFNAGDVLFDSLSTSVDLTGEEIRTNGTWLASVYCPLGRFSFAETVLLTPEENPEDYPSGGGRLVLRPGGIKTEAGYIYAGDAGEHRPYVSFQGGGLINWHLSAASAIEPVAGAEKQLDERLRLSFGLFQLFRVGYSSTLNLRLEGLLRPRGSWRAGEDPREYGLYLYPEISLTPDDRRNFFYRAVVSPVDISALHVVGSSWNIYQGFTLLAYTGIASGEKGDLFSLQNGRDADSPPAWFISAGCTFVF
ncbi:hypothetical protein [Marispirochaeta aestuarii]|uniref:hypothetical protein n=1 Tax=Marispirochaeta aestuarii TaxID=1963862 RepID=UPI0029C9A235|nr:hypothetical protein [Marispirochaeta aestuarii]